MMFVTLTDQFLGPIQNGRDGSDSEIQRLGDFDSSFLDRLLDERLLRRILRGGVLGEFLVGLP